MQVALMTLVRARLLTVGLVGVVLVALTTFLAAAQHRGTPPPGDYTPHKLADWTVAGPDADARRTGMLRRAAIRPSATDLAALPPADLPPSLVDAPLVACRFLNDPPSGTTAKFNCVLDGGDVIKVKYGHNPEIQGEVAGTRLLRLLGFPTDTVAIVPRLRCYGCPRDPFVTVVASTWTYTRELLGPAGFDHGYTDFEWVAIERKFPAPAIETDTTKGWAWWEMKHFAGNRADLDALRLLAVFLAHWDNKSENQRLVCLDAATGTGAEAGPQAGQRDCEKPLAMIQDLGATFGPTKVNLGSWPSVPIWTDRARCTVSMQTLPWEGGTFPDVQISEAGRRQIADGLQAISDDQLRDLFRAARFPEYQAGTDDERDLEAWVAAFTKRARLISEGPPCPDVSELHAEAQS